MTTQPMSPAKIRRLMRSPAVQPPPSEERIALAAWRRLQAYDRGRETGRLLGEMFIRGNGR